MGEILLYVENVLGTLAMGTSAKTRSNGKRRDGNKRT